MAKPLNGSRQAPLRRFVRASEALRRCNFRQHRIDVCVYSWVSADSPDRVGSLVLLHVDDFLTIGSPRGEEQFRRALSSFQTGPLECISETLAFTFLWINLVAGSFPEVGINPDPLIDRLGEAQLGPLAYQCRIICSRSDILRVFRRASGSFICLMQTQYYGCYLVTRLAASLTRKRPTPSDIEEVAALINKFVRTFKSTRLTIRYRRLFPCVAGLEELRRIKLLIFSDCGFSATHDNKYAESFITVSAIPLARDGFIQLKGLILDFPTHKIVRTSRSTLCEEAVALANALDNSIRLQSILLEMVFTPGAALTSELFGWDPVIFAVWSFVF